MKIRIMLCVRIVTLSVCVCVVVNWLSYPYLQPQQTTTLDKLTALILGESFLMSPFRVSFQFLLLSVHTNGQARSDTIDDLTMLFWSNTHGTRPLRELLRIAVIANVPYVFHRNNIIFRMTFQQWTCWSLWPLHFDGLKLCVCVCATKWKCKLVEWFASFFCHKFGMWFLHVSLAFLRHFIVCARVDVICHLKRINSHFLWRHSPASSSYAIHRTLFNTIVSRKCSGILRLEMNELRLCVC